MYTVCIAVVNIEQWTRSQNCSNLCRAGDVVAIAAGYAGNPFWNDEFKVPAAMEWLFTASFATASVAGGITSRSPDGVSVFWGSPTLLRLGMLVVVVRRRHRIIVVMLSASRLLCVCRMGVSHWYRGSHGKWALLFSPFVQGIVEWELTAQDELQCPWYLRIDCRWDWNQWRGTRFVLPIFQITIEKREKQLVFSGLQRFTVCISTNTILHYNWKSFH